MNFENPSSNQSQENSEEKLKVPETIKGDLVEFTTKEAIQYITNKLELQEKIFGKVLSEEELKKLERGIPADVMAQFMESMNLKPLTLDELDELKKANPEAVIEAGKWLKNFSKENP